MTVLIAAIWSPCADADWVKILSASAVSHDVNKAEYTDQVTVTRAVESNGATSVQIYLHPVHPIIETRKKLDVQKISDELLNGIACLGNGNSVDAEQWVARALARMVLWRQ